MMSKKCVSAIAITAFMLLSAVTILTSQRAAAASWLTTSDVDFNAGSYNPGPFETELQGTGVDAYVQNKKDMTNWIQKFPGTDTGPRSQFGFANDSQESRFILFGGLDGSSQWRNDTWEYNYAGANWEQICADNTPACGPPKRIGPSMAYDNNSKVVVMYGGIDDQGQTLADTWEYSVSTNTWANITPALSPKGVYAHKMVYDAKDKMMILYGQVGLPPTQSMELWAYDAATDTWTNRNTAGGPSLRSGFAFGYSYQANHQRAVFFGGGWQMSVYDDTWEYNYATNSWTQVSPAQFPAARSGASMTYNFKPSITGLILWGGNSWTTETWRYYWDVSTPTWSQVTVTTVPSPRQSNGLAYDPGYNALMIYGGEQFSGARLNDTWFLEAGYRLGGKYTKNYFNTGDVNTDWQYVFWNQSATLPPQTEIKLQMQASNTCDDAEPTSWTGPNGGSNTYYTISPSALWSGLDGKKCLRWQASLYTNDPSTSPHLEDVTIIYNVTGTVLPPTVIGWSPAGAQQPIDAPIHINFSKSMNINNVFVSVVPNVTFTLPWDWQGLNSQLTLWHPSDPFLEVQRYDVCVWGTDMLGLNLTGEKKCWVFTTRGTMPWIDSTIPAANAQDVPLAQPIIITFSEPMNTSTCWPYVTIDPKKPTNLALDGHTWTSGDRVLTMTHSVPFAQFTTYTVDVPISNTTRPCKDKSGLLLTVGPTAVPWQFTTLAVNPFITSTIPTNLQPEVAVNVQIKASFSRDMDQARFYYTVKEPDPTNPDFPWKNWTGGTFTVSWAGRTVTLSHTVNFANCKPYRVQMWALDLVGNSLIDNPLVANPWKFMTVGSSGQCAPFMISTMPYHQEQEVPLWKNVTIAWYFSPPDTGGMNAASFTFSLKDQWGNELSSHFVPNWFGQGPAVVELQHPGYPFDGCQEYTVRVLTARDTSNRAFITGPAENPFKFKTSTAVCPPLAMWSQPANGTLNVPLGQDIKLKFNSPMDTATVIVVIRPSITETGRVWTEGDTNLTISHTGFTACQWYNVSFFGQDKTGEFLGRGPVPNPFTFRAFCPPQGTYIVSTYPANGQTGIPLNASIWVNFSDPMDVNPGRFTFTLTASAGTLSFVWSNGDRTVRIDHSSPYIECDLYTARVVAAYNKSGGALVAGGVPNPWTFRAFCIAPYIVSTIPVNNAQNIGLGDSIQVTFSEPMDSTSLIFNTAPALVYTPQWPNAQTLVLSHANPFTICTDYTATVVQVRDLDGVNLVAGPVPNPWIFKSDCRFPVRGLQVQRVPPDVRLQWTADPAVQYWNVFHANDRLTPWASWTLLANLTAPGTNSYVHALAISDMQNHFYIVRGFKPGGWSSNSTMGALWHSSFSPNVGKPSAYWFSIPYNSIYKRAVDISNELKETKINVVAKFDASKQQTVIWYWSRGAWRGTNFNIAAGDGLMIGIVSSFDWAVNGTDRSVSMTFTFKPSARTNLYWISLPFTGKYGTASQLVTAIAGGLGPGTNTKITAVGKWVYSTQSSEVFAYTPTGWSGTDFIIGPGAGIWIEVTSTFAWVPELVTPESP